MIIFMKKNTQEKKSKLAKILGFISPRKDLEIWDDLKRDDIEDLKVKSSDKYVLMGAYLAIKYVLPLELVVYGVDNLSKQF